MKGRRKLPPDEILARLIRFGFRTGDIADRFEVTPTWVSIKKVQLGFEPMPFGPDRMRRNGARPTSRYFR